jgi:hypothetical protein
MSMRKREKIHLQFVALTTESHALSTRKKSESGSRHGGPWSVAIM